MNGHAKHPDRPEGAPEGPTLLPADVRRAASILLRDHMLGDDLPADECDDCIDLVAPLISEWVREDQARIDAAIARRGASRRVDAGIFGYRSSPLNGAQIAEQIEVQLPSGVGGDSRW